MYLTELTLWDEDAARLVPKDSYGWHKVIWRFFPDRKERDFLYRVDYNPTGLRIYILSAEKPALPPNLPQRIMRTREIPESFLAHEKYRFQVRVNPTRKIKSFDRDGNATANGSRVPLSDIHAVAEWFARKSAQCGFTVPHLDVWPSEECPLAIVREGQMSFCKPGLRRARHEAVQISGMLQVTDAAAFRAAFENGIGSAKAFGFGLLMLQPLA